MDQVTIITPDVVVTNDRDLADLADYVICASLPAKPGHEPRIETICASCKVGIYHQPFVPAAAVKVCWECSTLLIGKTVA